MANFTDVMMDDIKGKGMVDSEKKVSSVESTRLTQLDVDNLSKKDILILKDHGRYNAQFSVDKTDASGQVQTETYKFRTFYVDKNGPISVKAPNGKTMNYSEYTAEEIEALASGNAISKDYTTTSDVARKDVLMLSKIVNSYGKEAVRPVPIQNIDLNNPNQLIFDKSVYETAIQAAKQAEKQDANKASIAKAMDIGSKFESTDKTLDSEYE